MNALQDITQQPAQKLPILRIWRELNAKPVEQDTTAKNSSFVTPDDDEENSDTSN